MGPFGAWGPQDLPPPPPPPTSELIFPGLGEVAKGQHVTNGWNARPVPFADMGHQKLLRINIINVHIELAFGSSNKTPSGARPLNYNIAVRKRYTTANTAVSQFDQLSWPCATSPDCRAKLNKSGKIGSVSTPPSRLHRLRGNRDSRGITGTTGITRITGTTGITRITGTGRTAGSTLRPSRSGAEPEPGRYRLPGGSGLTR